MTMKRPETCSCDVAVIGMGMAGMAAALFAAGRDFSVIQTGLAGEISFSSGLIDVLGVHPVEEGRAWQNPWTGIEALKRAIPVHPYARVTGAEIRSALEIVLSFLEEQGLPYRTGGDRNLEMIVPTGMIKQTYALPSTMWSGTKAFREKASCLIVDFHGLTEFSSRQMSEALHEHWPGLRAGRVPFPGKNPQGVLVTGEVTATEMESRRNREELVRSLLPMVKDARYVGFPALFGMIRTTEIMSDLEQRIGLPVFEIPTFPVSVPGLRLNDAFAKGLCRKGVGRITQSRVMSVQKSGEGFLLRVGREAQEWEIQARGVVLATGRFWGRGLVAGRERIREPLLDLPVTQPTGREEWHRSDFLDPRGHPVNRAGIETDDLFRPLGRTGRPAFDRLFAAGSILAHQDWIRMKCGSGMAIASAYGAVKGLAEVLG